MNLPPKGTLVVCFISPSYNCYDKQKDNQLLSAPSHCAYYGPHLELIYLNPCVTLGCLEFFIRKFICFLFHLVRLFALIESQSRYSDNDHTVRYYAILNIFFVQIQCQKSFNKS